MCQVSRVVPDTLLKVLLSTNKTGHQLYVLRYTSHIVESVIKHQ
jgi:hypothetical protein